MPLPFHPSLSLSLPTQALSGPSIWWSKHTYDQSGQTSNGMVDIRNYRIHVLSWMRCHSNYSCSSYWLQYFIHSITQPWLSSDQDLKKMYWNIAELHLIKCTPFRIAHIILWWPFSIVYIYFGCECKAVNLAKMHNKYSYRNRFTHY